MSLPGLGKPVYVLAGTVFRKDKFKQTHFVFRDDRPVIVGVSGYPERVEDGRSRMYSCPKDSAYHEDLSFLSRTWRELLHLYAYDADLIIEAMWHPPRTTYEGRLHMTMTHALGCLTPREFQDGGCFLPMSEFTLIEEVAEESQKSIFIGKFREK
jgi:hypothetical protein